MDLLSQENKNNNKSKKIVLLALIICIVLFVILLIIAMFSKEKKVETISLLIDGVEKDSTMIVDNNGIKYISLQDICTNFGYMYNRGEYLSYNEDKNECYIKDNTKIYGFKVDSNKMYKTEEDSNLNFQYFELKHSIYSDESKLYISLDDLASAINLIVIYNEPKKQYQIESLEYYKNTIEETIIKLGYSSIYNDKESLKSLAYDMVIVSKNNLYGVLDADLKEIIGIKYDKIQFDEYTQKFIVSSNGKYGVINNKGEREIDLNYDKIEIISYNPLLYLVQKNSNYSLANKVGNNLTEFKYKNIIALEYDSLIFIANTLDNKYVLINSYGTELTNVSYDRLGCPADSALGSENTLIIPEIYEGIGDTIVVGINNLYGLVSIKTGDIICECELKAIYKKIKENNESEYWVIKQDGSTTKLYDYILSKQTITIIQ